MKSLPIGAALFAATALLMRELDFDRPPALDRRVRRFARMREMKIIRTALRPLFPLGLPGGYISAAYVIARQLRRKRRHGGPAIVTSAWLGWLVHRAVKLGYERERPRRPGVRRRMDSYPSGHTTGTTALAIATALVLHRERLATAPQVIAIGAGPPIVMGVYRVIADDHWATDVIGGWLLGAAIAVTCVGFVDQVLRTDSRRATRRFNRG